MGRDYPKIIAQALLQRDYIGSPVHKLLQVAVQRAIGEYRWRDSKRRQRGQPQQTALPPDLFATEGEGDAWIEAESFLEAFEKLDDQERKILNFRLANVAYEKIGNLLGISRDEARKIAKQAMEKMSISVGADIR